jgi:hypothetical protein
VRLLSLLPAPAPPHANFHFSSFLLGHRKIIKGASWHHGTKVTKPADFAISPLNCPSVVAGPLHDHALVAVVPVPCGLVCVRHNDIINGLHCKHKSEEIISTSRKKEKETTGRQVFFPASSVPVLPLRAPLRRGLPTSDSSTEGSLSLSLPAALRRNPRLAGSVPNGPRLFYAG